ncbi:MAG TPA: YhjD/YihY/BrkB family envelope integrity protein [Steroidobacteraceae bacterium]|nr:YhjD/YihY/BrkB family envelope integrity protein [Steroidobacteraceae bacterium]
MTPLARLRERIERLLFDRHYLPVEPANWLLDVLRYPFALVRDLLTGELNLRAMGLVYTTLLSLVPLAAFAFAVLKGLGVHRDLEPLIYEFLHPIGERATELTAQFMAFVDNVRGDVLGSVGLAFLLYTVISTIQKLEEAFNFAWHVERPRSIMRRVSEYLSLMVVGPVFIVIVFSLFGALGNHSTMRWLTQTEPFGSIVRAFGVIGPFLFVTGVFTFLYSFVPNTRVRLKAAFIGGLAAGLLWAGSGALFARIVAASTQMVAIYAGFAIFLATLIWIYLSWLIVLIGAQLSFYVQNPRYLRVGQGHVRLTSALRERLAFTVMLLVARRFVAGEPPCKLRALAEDLEIPGSALAGVTRSLEQSGLLSLTEDEEVVPARDLEGIQLADILNAVRDERQYESWLLWRARTEPAADEVANSVEAGMRERIAGMTLRDLATPNLPRSSSPR